MKESFHTETDFTAKVCAYISRGADAKLPPEVIAAAKHHILDALAAMVSGSMLQPGQVAREFVNTQPGAKEAQVVGSGLITSAIDAAFANGIMAHADETDDSHAGSLTHPGCAIVPAALAVAERAGADGACFLRGVVVGYDIGCRMTQALGVMKLRERHRSTHSIGGTFGAAAAAAAVLRLNADRTRYVLSYAAQQASGVAYVVRDEGHIEKAFVFGGMPARNGVTAAVVVQSGFTGVRDPFSGERNFFETVHPSGSLERLAEGLGSHYEILYTNIKKFSVGSPIQAPLDALFLLMQHYEFTVNDVQRILVRGPGSGMRTVNDREMPDISLQHILALALLDGDLTFEAAHSYERMRDPAVLALKERIAVVADPEISAAKNTRQAIVEVTTTDGRNLREHVVNVRGTADNPMGVEEVEKKCSELLKPVLGQDKTRKLIETVRDLEQVNNIRELRPLLSSR